MSQPIWHQAHAVTVENRAPDAADHRKLVHLAGGDATKAHRVVHWVHLHLSGRPPVKSTAYHLQIGSERIPQYVESPAGISFKVHDAGVLQGYYGKPIKFVSDDGDEYPTGARFPDLSGQLTRQVGQKWQQRYP